MSRRTTQRKTRSATAPAGSNRLNYANVTATIALFVALGGTSYAAIKLPAKSVGTIQLKARAVTSSKLAPRAVDGSKVRDGSLTSADIAGKLSAAISADTLAQIRHASVAGASDPAPAGGFTGKSTTATCPAGTFVVGGGASVSDRINQLVDDSYPSSTTGWTASVTNFGATAPAFTVYAICIPAVAAS